jgi:hypothetical protein
MFFAIPPQIPGHWILSLLFWNWRFGAWNLEHQGKETGPDFSEGRLLPNFLRRTGFFFSLLFEQQ